MNGLAGPEFLHYPDVAAAGDLRRALQDRFDVGDVPLRALHVPSPGWLRVGAEVRVADRHAIVVMARDVRCFLLQLWMRDVHMAKGDSADLDDIAAAIWSSWPGPECGRWVRPGRS